MVFVHSQNDIKGVLAAVFCLNINLYAYIILIWNVDNIIICMSHQVYFRLSYSITDQNKLHFSVTKHLINIFLS